MAHHPPQTFNPPDVAPPKPSYSHVCTTSLYSFLKLVTVAGQIGRNENGEVPPTFHEQVAIALANLGKCLAAAGATPRDIVKVTHYIVNYDPADKVRTESYVNFMGDHRPPSTVLGVACLASPELLYEIEVMAIVNG